MPCSGLTGAFLKERPSADVCNWYTGLCFLDYLDALPPIKRDLEGPTRAIVANKFSVKNFSMKVMAVRKFSFSFPEPSSKIVACFL